MDDSQVKGVLTCDVLGTNGDGDDSGISGRW